MRTCDTRLPTGVLIKLYNSKRSSRTGHVVTLAHCAVSTQNQTLSKSDWCHLHPHRPQTNLKVKGNGRRGEICLTSRRKALISKEVTKRQSRSLQPEATNQLDTTVYFSAPNKEGEPAELVPLAAVEIKVCEVEPSIGCLMLRASEHPFPQPSILCNYSLAAGLLCVLVQEEARSVKKIWKTGSQFKREGKNLRLYEEEMEDNDEDIPAPAGGGRFACLNANVQNVIFMVSLLRLNKMVFVWNSGMKGSGRYAPSNV